MQAKAPVTKSRALPLGRSAGFRKLASMGHRTSAF